MNGGVESIKSRTKLAITGDAGNEKASNFLRAGREHPELKDYCASFEAGLIWREIQHAIESAYRKTTPKFVQYYGNVPVNNRKLTEFSTLLWISMKNALLSLTFAFTNDITFSNLT